MGDKSEIEWCDATWNCLIGCSKCSPGCDHCYAILSVGRGEAMGTAQHVGLTVKLPDGTRDWTGEVREVPHLLDQPLRWRRPRRIFVNSLSDVFHPDVSDEFICKMWTVMRKCPQHTFQILTKRPQRMADVVSRIAWRTPTTEEGRAGVRGYQAYLYGDVGDGPENQRSQDGPEILPNVWLGTSIENDRYSFRANHVRATPAAVRWISAEPLLGPLPSLDLTGIDWLVVGGESTTAARPMHPGWARELRDRCRAHTIACPNDTNGDGDCALCARPALDGSVPAGRHPRPIPFHFKQWGSWGVDHDAAGRSGPDVKLVFARPFSERDHERGIYMRRMGKKAAGRVLDGNEHDGYPA